MNSKLARELPDQNNGGEYESGHSDKYHFPEFAKESDNDDRRKGADCDGC